MAASNDGIDAVPGALGQSRQLSESSKSSRQLAVDKARHIIQTGRRVGHQCHDSSIRSFNLFHGPNQAAGHAHANHDRPDGVKSWLRLIVGLEHSHNLSVHLRVHFVQDVLVILFGICFGLALYKVVKATGWDKHDQKEAIYFVCYPGMLFINLITMIALPLLFTSITTGVAAVMGAYHTNAKLFRNSTFFVVGIVFLAVAIGLTLGELLSPGHTDPSDYLKKKALGANTDIVDEADRTSALAHIMTTLDSLIPKNIVVAIVNNNLVGFCFFSVIFGLAASTLDDHDDIVLRFLEQLNQCFVRMLPYRWQPYAVFFLVAKVVATNASDLGNILKSLGVFFGAVVLGLSIIALVLLPSIYYLVTRKPPFKYMHEMEAPLLVALCTSSSQAAMPYTMHAVGINWPKTATARFVVPMGSQLNMPGTALFQAVVIAYIAQVTGHPLSFVQCVATTFFLLIASMTTAGVPGASLVTIVYALRAVAPDGQEDLWVNSIALVLPVDKILDMLRTCVNVLADTICCAVVDVFQEGEPDTTGQVPGFKLSDTESDGDGGHDKAHAHCGNGHNGDVERGEHAKHQGHGSTVEHSHEQASGGDGKHSNEQSSINL